MTADLVSVQLSSCHPERMTSASVPASGEGTGSVRGQWEVFVERSSGKERWKVLESAGVRVLGSKEGPALKEKGRERRADSLGERTEAAKQGKEE